MTKRQLERLCQLSVKEMDYGGVIDEEDELAQLRSTFAAWEPAGAGRLTAGVPESLDLSTRIEELERERDEARALLAEAWEWTTPYTRGKLGYVDLGRRVKAALEAKEEPGSHGEPPGE